MHEHPHPLERFLEEYAQHIDSTGSPLRYKQLHDAAFARTWPEPNTTLTEPILFAVNDWRPPNGVHQEWHQGIPNGWPTASGELNEFIHQHWGVNNQGLIFNIRGADDLDNKLNSGEAKAAVTFINEWDIRNLTQLQGLIEIQGLGKIPEGTAYVYPIIVYGGGHIFIKRVKERGVDLPERVVRDCRAGLAKILYSEVYEGHGFNDTHMREMMEVTAQYNNIPIECQGFLDGNYFTPELQKEYNTKGFFYPFWEYHVAGNPGWAASAKQLYEHLFQLTYHRGVSHYPHKFLNLNRRVRPHRTLLTLAISEIFEHTSKWSYTGLDLEQVSSNPHGLEYLLREKNIMGDSYVNAIPKHIDIDESINETSINTDLQYSAHVNITSETMFFENNTLFFSEKIFKPLLAGQPFILSGPAGSLELLRRMGYRTFDPIIDESYDRELNPARRMLLILKEMRRIADMSDEELHRLDELSAEICLHNHQTIVRRTFNTVPQLSALSEIYRWWKNV
jgi:hypothetical protein